MYEKYLTNKNNVQGVFMDLEQVYNKAKGEAMQIMLRLYGVGELLI